MKAILLTPFFLFSILFIQQLTAQEYFSFNEEFGAIDDNNCAAVPNIFDAQVSGIPTNSGIFLQNVAININHTWAEDLDIYLIAPNNYVLTLSTDNGGSGDHYSNTNFVISGIAQNGSIISASAPFTGYFYPEGSTNGLPTVNMNGTWRLEICDDDAFITGTLTSWRLTFGKSSSCFRNPRAIACNQSDTYTTTGGANDYNTALYYTGCGVPDPTVNNFNGPDIFYELNVPQSCNVTINLTNLGADLDLFLDDYSHFCAQFAEQPEAESSNSLISCYASLNTDLTAESITAFLPAGTYGIIVDGFDPAIKGSYTISVTSDCPGCQQQQQCNTCSEPAGDTPMGLLQQCDNFESYQLTNISPQSAFWNLWDANADDAPVVTNPTGTDKVLKIERTTTDPDVLYLLGNRTSGRYRLSWSMYVPNDFGAYYNIQHSQTPGNWAYEVYFNADGTGSIELGNSNTPVGGFSYYAGNWNKVMQIIDIDNNKAEFWINGQFVFSWPFSTGTTTSNMLGAVNFYAGTGTKYYINDICLWQVQLNCGIVPPWQIIDGVTPVCGKNGEFFNSPDAARCAGYISEEWENCSTICDYGGTFIYRSDNFMGNLELIDLPPGMIGGESCVLDVYGGALPDNLYGDVYVFYNEPGGQIIVSPTIANDAETFVFRCDCEDASGNPEPCQQICLGTANDVANNPSNPEGFYYLLVLSAASEAYGFNIFPTGECSTNPVNISCGQSLPGDVTGTDNDFDMAGNGYETCYNGTRSYTGEDKEYKLTLQTAAVIDVTLTSGTPMGLFLYSYLCGENCIGYAENSPQGGQALLDSLPLAAGVYYIVVDKNTPGGVGTFNISVSCQNNITLPFAITNDAATCNVNNTTPHVINIPATAYPLSTDDMIHFLYKDGTSLKTNDQLSRFWNGTSLMQFSLPKDATGDAPKCSYIVNDSFYVYVTKSDNGFRNFRRLKPIFQPLSPPNVTATYRYANNGRGVINQMVEAEKVINFTVTPTFLNPPATPPVDPYISFDLNTSIPWTLQPPTVSWLSIPGNQTGSSNKRFYVVLEPNLSPLPRETTVSLISNTTPQYIQEVLIKQQGACLPPDVDIVFDPPITCAGDSVDIIVQVPDSLQNLYTYQWSTGETTTSIRKKANPGASFTLTITEGNCFTSTTIPISPPIEAIPNQPGVSQTMIIGCPGSAFPTVIANVGANQIVDWYTAASGGTLVSSTNSFSPPLAGTYFGETRNLNGGQCTSSSRTQVVFSLNPDIAFNATANDLSLCPGQSTIISASANGGSGGFTYQWDNNIGPGQSHNITPGATTTYSVTATDINNCVATSQVTVTLLPPVVVSAGQDEGICPGTSTTITADAVSESGNITYLWDQGLGAGASHIVSPTSPTTYSVTATDGNGCSDVDQVTINVFPNLTVSIPAPQAICPGQSATISASASGGSNGSYSFQWDQGLGAGSTKDVSPSATTTYHVVVTDGNGCNAQSQVTVVVHPAISINAADIPPVCPGQTTVLNAIAIGGGGSFTYNWDNNIGTGQSPVISPITTTTYTVTATDANQCSASDQVTVSVFPALVVNANDNLSICLGDNTVVNAIAIGGTNNFTYTWNNGLGVGQFHSVSPSSTTTYTVTATDGNNCAAADQVTVTLLQPPVVIAGTYQPICAGQSITLNASATGQGNSFTFNWDNDLGTGATQSVSPASTTTYTVIATDINGCQSSDSTTIQVSIPSQASIAEVVPYCSGDTIYLLGHVDGGATEGTWFPSISGGVFIYGPNDLYMNSFVPPSAYSGVFIMELRSNAQAPCPIAVDAISITVNPLPAINANGISDTCALSLDTYTLLLNTDADSLTTTLGIVTNYGNGSFSVSNIPEETGVTVELIQTQTGCISQTVFNGRNCECPTIAPPQSANNVTVCAGETIPPLSVNDDSGLLVRWYESQSGGNAIGEGLTFETSIAGTYYAELVDLNSACVSSTRIAVTLVIKDLPIADAGPDQLVCPLDTALLSASQGNNYAYEWDNGSQEPDNPVVVSETSTFVLSVTQDGCTATDTVVVGVLSVPGGDILITQEITCPRDSSGALIVIPTGEHPPFSVLWSTGSSDQEITGLFAYNYSVVVTDSLGCRDTLSFFLPDAEGFDVTEDSIHAATNGQNNGFIEITVTGNNGPYTFEWSNNAGPLPVTDEDIYNLPPSNYFLNVYDADSCKQSFVFVVPTATGTQHVAMPLARLVKVYPTPNSGRFAVAFDLPEALEVEISVLDMLGQAINIGQQTRRQTLQRQALHIDLSDQAAGVYLVRIRIADEVLVLKVVVE